jgi:hypothetical protein
MIRTYYSALSLLAVLSSPAICQIGVISGPTFAGLSCTASVPSPAQIRPEGYTELLGDIVITCTGGAAYQLTASVPATNVVVYIQPSVPITSRILDTTTGLSEALLLVDDPGSGLTAGANGNYGPNAPQSLCTSLNCTASVEVDQSGQYLVATTAPSPGSPNAANDGAGMPVLTRHRYARLPPHRGSNRGLPAGDASMISSRIPGSR